MPKRKNSEEINCDTLEWIVDIFGTTSLLSSLIDATAVNLTENRQLRAEFRKKNPNLPNGIYFDGVPIQIEALAMPGYQFSHWESNGLITDTLNAVFLDTLTTASISFKAHFVPTELKPSVFLIYPNPTKDLLYLKGLAENMNGEITVHNALGQLMLSCKTNKSINVGNLAKGWYILTI